ncbi:MAG: exosortase Q, partial [Zoogloeaceae bacterium]|nr:exosortase Q [Zoogloeaceae bacterium]
MTHAARLRFFLWLDRLPPVIWLVLPCLAVWPHVIWMARRMADGSDDPLGIVALVALAIPLWRHRRHLRHAPHAAWLAAALLLSVLASVTWNTLPPLASTLLALLAFASGILALLPARTAAMPVLGLAALSLPLMASLQFYAGYPLRVLVAELSRWLLLLGHQVERAGAALWVDGQLILVDAACSGVQLAWLGYFTACVTALMTQHPNARFLARLPAVGLLVLLGNVLRNTVLVAAQADGRPLAHWLHEGVGLFMLAAVCIAIAALMQAQPR